MKKLLLLVACLGVSLSACSAEPVTSSFCALVSAQGKDVSEVIALMDRYSADTNLKRGAPSPNGILYAEAKKQFIINVTPVGPRGTEVSFFPRVPGTFASEAKALEAFVVGEVAERFEVKHCEAVEGYGKGVIYGYERIAI